MRFGGRPNMQWIDCIIEDLKTFNISNNSKEEWPKIGNFTLDQVKCKSFFGRSRNGFLILIIGYWKIGVC